MDLERRSVSAADVGRLSPTQFAERFDQVAPRLWCIAAAVVRDRSLADDVLQEAAMIALRKLDQYEPGTQFVAWMARIVRLTALNLGRRRARLRAAEGGDAGLHAAAPPADETGAAPVDGRGRLVGASDCFDDQLLAALDTLEETARACLLLRTVLDLPYAEIARALDIPEGTAMSHVHRARHALRERLAAGTSVTAASRDGTLHA